MRALLFLTLAFVACCTRPPNTPAPDASDAASLDTAAMACSHLRVLHCPLGSDPGCEAAFTLPSKFRADPSCVLGVDVLDGGDASAGLAACNVTCQP